MGYIYLWGQIVRLFVLLVGGALFLLVGVMCVEVFRVWFGLGKRLVIHCTDLIVRAFQLSECVICVDIFVCLFVLFCVTRGGV